MATKQSKAAALESGRPAYLTVEDVARQLQVTTKTVRVWLLDGHLSGHRIPAGWRISQQAVDHFLGDHRKAVVTPEGTL